LRPRWGIASNDDKCLDIVLLNIDMFSQQPRFQRDETTKGEYEKKEVSSYFVVCPFADQIWFTHVVYLHRLEKL
jgi:hypothetical protein